MIDPTTGEQVGVIPRRAQDGSPSARDDEPDAAPLSAGHKPPGVPTHSEAARVPPARHTAEPYACRLSHRGARTSARASSGLTMVGQNKKVPYNKVLDRAVAAAPNSSVYQG